MNKRAKQEPQIRVQGFDDAWEQRKFGDTVVIERGGSPRPIDKFITDDEKGLNWVKIGDAPEHGNYITRTAEKIKPEGLSKTREVHPGDLILSNSMSFGKPYIMGIDGCIHDGWLLIRDKEKNFDLKFLCILLGTDNMLNQYKSRAAGSTVNNLNKELVSGTIISYPSMKEQIRIGKYFDNLDNLITLHQREYDKLKNIKHAMLEKMFPKMEENFPEIRFKGFMDAWKPCKLKDIANKVTAKNIDTLYVETLTNSAELGVISQKDYFDHDVSNLENIDGYYIVENNDFVYNPRISTLAPVGPINRNKLGRTGVMSPLYTVFRTHDVDEDYVEWFFKSSRWHKFMYFNGDTGARSDRFAIKDDVFFEMPIPIPHIDEQRKIGEFFCQLDRLIELENKELEKIKHIKIACLEKMFV